MHLHKSKVIIFTVTMQVILESCERCMITWLQPYCWMQLVIYRNIDLNKGRSIRMCWLFKNVLLRKEIQELLVYSIQTLTNESIYSSAFQHSNPPLMEDFCLNQMTGFRRYIILLKSSITDVVEYWRTLK